jgi:site-specific DNA recombinase
VVHSSYDTKQGVAEWYVTEMLEKSWGGFEQHTEQGYNIGKPCYGYRGEAIEHPNPAKRAKGQKKTKLEAHDTESLVVRKMFVWRVAEQIGYQAIADRLNVDLVTNPPPTPVKPSEAVGMWTYSNVREVLTNPKRTGHMVWNRRARKGNGRNRINPPSEWVWSKEPVHEPLIDLETFVQAQQVAQRRERSRTAAGKRNDPQAKHVYRLRSYLYCHICGRRMSGNTMKGHSYYACAPKKAWRSQEHPTIFRVREDSLLDALGEFLSTRIFGAYRHNLLDANLQTLNDTSRRDHATHVKALQSSIAEQRSRAKTCYAASKSPTVTILTKNLSMMSTSAVPN